MGSLLPQDIQRRALVERLAAPFLTPGFRAAQQARMDALAEALDREHAATQPQQHHDVLT